MFVSLLSALDTWSQVKFFVIQHPEHLKRLLISACNKSLDSAVILFSLAT